MAVLGGIFVAMIYVLAFIDEAVEHRAMKAGFPRGLREGGAGTRRRRNARPRRSATPAVPRRRAAVRRLGQPAQLRVIFRISASRSMRDPSSPTGTRASEASTNCCSSSRSTSSTARPSVERISISMMS